MDRILYTWAGNKVLKKTEITPALPERTVWWGNPTGNDNTDQCSLVTISILRVRLVLKTRPLPSCWGSASMLETGSPDSTTLGSKSCSHEFSWSCYGILEEQPTLPRAFPCVYASYPCQTPAARYSFSGKVIEIRAALGFTLLYARPCTRHLI